MTSLGWNSDRVRVQSLCHQVCLHLGWIVRAGMAVWGSINLVTASLMSSEIRDGTDSSCCKCQAGSASGTDTATQLYSCERAPSTTNLFSKGAATVLASVRERNTGIRKITPAGYVLHSCTCLPILWLYTIGAALAGGAAGGLLLVKSLFLCQRCVQHCVQHLLM